MPSDPRPLVMHVINALEGGGTEGALVSLLHRLDRSRFRHGVVTLRSGGRLATELPSDVACWAIGAQGRDRASALRLGQIARRWRPAVIHARNTGTWTDALVAGLLHPRAKVILGFHGLDHTGPFPRAVRRAARWAVRLGADFTSVSESGRRRLVEELAVPETRITVLPNGVDVDRLTPPSPREREAARHALGVRDGDFVVGAVGSLTAVKRVDVLIEALRLEHSRFLCSEPRASARADLRRKTTVPLRSERHTKTGLAPIAPQPSRVRAVLVGDGPLRSELRNQAAQAGLGDRVVFAGAQADVRACLWAFDALLSCSDSEEMSNAILEGMACGVPVVATDVGDSALMIGGADPAGIIVPKGDAGAMADAIAQLAGAPSQRASLGRNARVRTNHYTITQATAAYDEFYSQVRPGAAPAATRHPNQTASMVMSSLCGAAPTNATTCLRT